MRRRSSSCSAPIRSSQGSARRADWRARSGVRPRSANVLVRRHHRRTAARFIGLHNEMRGAVCPNNLPRLQPAEHGGGDFLLAAGRRRPAPGRGRCLGDKREAGPCASIDHRHLHRLPGGAIPRARGRRRRCASRACPSPTPLDPRGQSCRRCGLYPSSRTCSSSSRQDRAARRQSTSRRRGTLQIRASQPKATFNSLAKPAARQGGDGAADTSRNYGRRAVAASARPRGRGRLLPQRQAPTTLRAPTRCRRGGRRRRAPSATPMAPRHLCRPRDQAPRNLMAFYAGRRERR